MSVGHSRPATNQPRFLADHDLNDHIVRGLKRLAPEAIFLRAREVGLDRADDAVLLEYAAKEQLLVVSHDESSMYAAAIARMAADQPMVGLLLVHQSDPIRPIIDDLHLIWDASPAREWDGQIVFLPL